MLLILERLIFAVCSGEGVDGGTGRNGGRWGKGDGWMELTGRGEGKTQRGTEWKDAKEWQMKVGFE